MRSRSPVTAVQLRSVAGRYQLPARLAPTTPAWQVTGWSPVGGPSNGDPGASEGDELAQKLARLEAVLFLAREPLSSRKLSQHANLADGTEARTLVRRLNERLDAAGRAFRVQEVAGGFQLTTRRKFANWLRRLDYIRPEERLSAPSLETLAVVAYRQPVMRAEIEAIRGVGCGEILTQLMSRDLVRVGGRSPELGRPYLYNTTKRFLQLFGLRSLEDLPRAELFRQATIPSHEITDPTRPVPQPASVSEVEEESDVSVSVVLTHLPKTNQPTDLESESLDERHLRMEDEDFEEEEEDEDFEDEDFDDEEEEEEDEEYEDEEDEEYEDEEEEFEEDEEEEYEEEDYEEDEEDEEEYEEEDEDEYEEDEELDEELEEEVEDEEEDEEWEEVEEDEEDEEDEDWEDEDWEDEEEWED